jgi:radical SAM superfamily enzyme YgiQ (UPF0313 family)
MNESGIMKLKLISPGFRDMHSAEFKSLMFRYWFPTLSLPMIAAVTPSNFEISFTDELFDIIDFAENVDIVGITGMTAQAPRAYEIADAYRKRNVPVVIGGIHASILPEEAITHCDSVIIGEGEVLWPQVLDDFIKGELKQFYRSNGYIGLNNLPAAKREIYSSVQIPKNGSINSVQTSRGCPFDCDFCSVTKFFGNKYRLRPLDEVMFEIESLRGNFISVVDDNVVGNIKYATDFFKRLSEHNLQWTGQSSINIADNIELLKVCAESGCNGLLIGIESIDQQNLIGINKKTNRVYKYAESIKRIQDKGIKVLGSFIFGLDNDNPSVFESTIKFIQETDLAIPLFNILTPYPGTRTYQSLESQNRIFNHDWSYYTSTNVVFEPENMTVDELEDGYKWAYTQLHSRINKSTPFRPVGW